jgi:hypothetical protein
MSNGIRVRAFALFASVMLLTLSLGAGVASAGGRDSRNADNTFTKWLTVWPAMAGVVGGDVGDGAFAGEVLDATFTDTSATLDVHYHFDGSRHSFTASVHVVQTGLSFGGTAVITGQVTEGWLKGNLVQGGYTVVACDHDQITNDTCYQGWLDILRGTKSAG